MLAPAEANALRGVAVTTSAPATGARSRTVEVLALLDEADAEVRRVGRDDLAARLERQRVRVVDPVCQVLVIGEFKKGKSALVNGLLNARVCPVDADVVTAAPTVVRSGPEVRATVALELAGADGSPNAPAQERRRVSLASLQSWATERGVESGGRQVHSVDIELPRGLLQQGLVLVDTPGVGGGLASAHAAATLRALSMADALIFVSDASQEYSAPELDFLKQAAEMCPNVVCVLTKIDFYPQWRRIVELDRAHLRRAGLDYELLPVSSPLRHHALRTGDRELDVESGFPRLSAYLRTRVLAEKEALAVRSAAGAVRSSLGQLVGSLGAEHATLADPTGTAALVKRLEGAQQRAERLLSSASRWQQVLNDRFGDMISNLDMDLAVRLRAIRKDAVARVNETDPTKTWNELQQWLYQRTNQELVAHFTEIRSQAETVAAEVARHYDADVGDLMIELDVADLTLPLQDLQLGASRFERLSLLELGLLAARGSTSSIAITSMAGSALAVLAVPTMVLLPAAALLAVTLARSVLRQVKESQLKSNRLEAIRAINAYLDEAELIARKDSRDSLRHINRRLRDYFTERAEELRISAKQSLEATARAIKTDQEARKRRLHETVADLERLQARIAAADRLLGPGDVGDQVATS
jgi:hypothetical protein